MGALYNECCVCSAGCVFVYDQKVVGIALHRDFSVVLDEGLSVPSEVLEQVARETKSGNITTNVSTHFGSDGDRTRLGIQRNLYRLAKRFGEGTSEKRPSVILLIPNASLLKLISSQK